MLPVSRNEWWPAKHVCQSVRSFVLLNRQSFCISFTVRLSRHFIWLWFISVCCFHHCWLSQQWLQFHCVKVKVSSGPPCYCFAPLLFLSSSNNFTRRTKVHGQMLQIFCLFWEAASSPWLWWRINDGLWTRCVGNWRHTPQFNDSVLLQLTQQRGWSAVPSLWACDSYRARCLSIARLAWFMSHQLWGNDPHREGEFYFQKVAVSPCKTGGKASYSGD